MADTTHALRSRQQAEDRADRPIVAARDALAAALPMLPLLAIEIPIKDLLLKLLKTLA